MRKKNNRVGGYIPQTTEPKGNSTIKKYFVAAALGFLVFLGAMLILCFSGALIIAKSSDPATLVPFVSTVSTTVAALLGGFVSSKKAGGSSVFSSLIFLSAIILSIILMTVIFLRDSHETPIWQDLLLKIPMILATFFGGLVGNIKKKPKSLYAKYK